MVKRICKICGKEFFAKPSAIKKGQGKFCSRKCMGKWFSKHRKGKDHPSWQGGKIKRICETCGKEFETIPARIKRGHGKFCSRECYGKWLSKHRKGKNTSNWRGGKVKRICETCGNEFSVDINQTKQGGGKFCSRRCTDKWQSKHRRGENHPAWKNGASFEPYCIKWNEPFREYIREKFGRVCFLCSKTEEENGKRLSVHHCNGNKNCGCDGDETCQFVPLCVSCHSKVHSKKVDWEKKIKDKMHNKLSGWYI